MHSGFDRLQDMAQAVGGAGAVKVRSAPSIDNPFVVVNGESRRSAADLGFLPRRWPNWKRVSR